MWQNSRQTRRRPPSIARALSLAPARTAPAPPLAPLPSGDSWRARVSHICELQVNLAAGAMTIDFGGLDRWDYAERARNLDAAARAVA